MFNEQGAELKVLIAPADRSSESVIAIPAEVSWTGRISMGGASTVAHKTPADLSNFLKTEASLNGLDSTELRPWHLLLSYEQFDEDGDKVHSGTFEEFWAGPKKYKTIYKSDNLNQTDYATEKGLFRLGDQRWPSRAEIAAREEVVAPFAYAATLQGFRIGRVEHNFSGHMLDCVLFENTKGISTITQYCFDHDGTALRYSRGFGWNQTVYNDLVRFQDRSVARDVEVTDGGKPYLKIHVKTLESPSLIPDDELVPPAETVILSGERLTGVNPKPVLEPFPDWPMPLIRQHFSVTVKIVIGKNGHVLSAQGIEGPADAYRSAEESVKKWVFQPYLVMGEPEEVETKVILSNN